MKCILTRLDRELKAIVISCLLPLPYQLLPDPDDVPRCRILSPDKTEWWLISDEDALFVADQLWFMTRIREEEEEVTSKRSFTITL